MRMLRPCWCLCACIAVSVAASAEPDSVPHADTAQPDVNLDTTLVESQLAPPTHAPSGNATSIPPHPPEGDAERDPASALSTVSSPSSTPTAAPTETVDVSSYGVESPIASSKSFETSAATADVDSSSSSSAPPPSASPEPSPAPTPPVVLVDVPAPAPPVIEELPLTEAPPAPEFLSFNEWRERYVVQPDSSAARRTKKRPRQDAAAPGVSGGGGGAERDDAPDEGGTASAPLEVVETAGKGGVRLDGVVSESQGQVVFADGALGLAPTASSSLSPIQPLPNVGTGEPSDPLVHLKDRANYAGAECAAKLHRSSRQSKGASSILTEKKDRYMLTPCAATPKFVDVELCDEVQIDALVLANYEFFSSTFKHFKASCSVDYPGKPDDWHDLGTFRARNVRGLQVFRPLSNPPFCRYVRIDFLSHFGSEYYCPVSLLRVYGYTQLESFRESERKAKAIEQALAAAAELGEDEADVDEGGSAIDGAREIEVDKVERVEAPTVGANVTAGEERPASEGTPAGATTAAPVEATLSDAPSTPASPVSVPTTSSAPPNATEIASVNTPSTGVSSDVAQSSSLTMPPSTSTSLEAPSASSTPSVSTPSEEPSPAATDPSSVTSTDASAPSAATSSSSVSAATASSALPADASPAPSSSSTVLASPSATHTPANNNSTASATATHTATGRPAVGSDTPISSPPLPPPSSRNDSHSPLPSASYPPVQRAPVPPPPPPPAVAQPQPGESIYGTIMKRLASLEHNQTLAMGFIEAQSGMLREAFARVERRLGDVEGSRSRQEQSIRQSLLELEKQRVELERERLALATQVTLLTQEVRFEKRLTVAQLVGLLLLVVFVGFTRGIPTSPFLHVAAATSGARAGKRKVEAALGGEGSGRDREKEWEEQRVPGQEDAKIELRENEVPRRTHRISPSASLSRHQSAKRYPSISKPGALRRHYGPMTGSSSSSAKALSRSWTPPVRHSSAPPEDALGAGPSALADAVRRHVVPRGPRPPGTPSGAGAASRTYEFPPRSPGSSGAASPARGAATATSPQPLQSSASLSLPPPHPPSSTHLTPQSLASLRVQDLSPSTPGNKADTQPSSAPVHTRAGLGPVSVSGSGSTTVRGGLPFPLDTAPSYDGYQTYSSEEDVPPTLAPVRRPGPTPQPDKDRDRGKGKGKARVSSPSSSSAASATSPGGARPPRGNVPPRPATAIGIRLPSNEEVATSSGEKTREGQEGRFSVQSPRSALPSPPPEPASPQRVDVAQNTKER